MLITTNLKELISAKEAIDELGHTKPELFQRFINVIQLTRQLQFNYQYLGCLIMDENPDECKPSIHNTYAFSVFEQEIEKLKADTTIIELQYLLASNKRIGYANLCKLVIGENPRFLVGPQVV
ncbi:hypothetical protein [Oceanobacillus profundus]|uniref:Uncharacterized protein n=1 Tax=Oceanobacillus profundus TaxID=372463 RepID=A0A417YNG2_9BACI|nr:hypothetical protein [Oceanobacillus profundus]PAE29018.1 hypothetical protein CHI07_11390 [Paenibacillus sp. 7884-2]RHW35239.1 hypothetical protein D1B32_01070 [Oceanobacillus profundus]